MTDQRKTLLILGSMDEFVLLVQRATERGCRVLVADGYEQGPARAYAYASFTVPATSTETLAHLCREHEVGALITSFSDTLFEAGCQVAYAAGLAAPLAPDKLECLRDKERMKEMFSHLGIPYPHSRVAPAEKAERACDGMRFPCAWFATQTRCERPPTRRPPSRAGPPRWCSKNTTRAASST